MISKLEIPSVEEQRRINDEINSRIAEKKPKTKQDYVTPMNLIAEIELRFGLQFVLDLAGTEENKRCEHVITPEDDSLLVSWEDRMNGILLNDMAWHGMAAGMRPAAWLNPEFGQTAKYMRKAADQGIIMVSLTLASIGSAWYQNFVRPNAMSLITDRITFDGETQGFNRDTMISLWGMGLTGLGWWDRRVLGAKP